MISAIQGFSLDPMPALADLTLSSIVEAAAAAAAAEVAVNLTALLKDLLSNLATTPRPISPIGSIMGSSRVVVDSFGSWNI
jgi:hypothetical protein